MAFDLKILLLDLVYPLTIIIGAYVVSVIVKRYLLGIMKEWSSRTKTRIDDIIVNEVNSVVSWVVYLLAIYLIVEYFGGIVGLERAILAVGVIIVGKAIVNIITSFIKEYIHVLPLDEDQKKMLLGVEQTIKVLLYILVVLVMLASVGIDVWPIITSLGIGGLAISMALKDVLTDYISGLITILGRSLKKGDRIVVKDKGVEGVVEEIGWRYTVIRMDDGSLVTVPNRVVSSSVIIFKENDS